MRHAAARKVEITFTIDSRDLHELSCLLSDSSDFRSYIMKEMMFREQHVTHLIELYTETHKVEMLFQRAPHRWNPLLDSFLVVLKEV